MKSIGLITLRKDTGVFLKKQLDDMLKNQINVNLYVLEEINRKISIVNESIVVLTGLEALNKSREKIDFNCEYIIANRTINHNLLYKLLELEKGQDVFLVNDFKGAAHESINYLNILGINHVNYIPFYPGAEDNEKITIAVTNGEFEYIPKYVEKIIDIGIRKIDISTIVEILNKIKLSGQKIGEIASNYIIDIIALTKNINEINLYNEYIKNKFGTIINAVNDGIIAIDKNNKISILNDTAEKIFDCDKKKLLGKDIFEEKGKLEAIHNFFAEFDCVTNDIIDIDNKKIVISQSKVFHNKSDYEKILVIKDVTEIQNLEYDLRRKIMKNMHFAKYTFDDILGNSHIINKTKKMGEKIAKVDSPVLIYGETGTGKELFAQAIHLLSTRKNNPFIAINFAAMSESLIESELFGYVEGAFTGAKKGGMAGIFEQAHGGTVFLDEIGDAPINFQIKLLRVLQEKQVRRIGDNKIIPVDTRIIAATNKDIIKLVDEGKFREDLYYRLNVLPLYLPALRERKQDILILSNKFYEELHKNNIDFNTYINDVKDILSNYDWPGNVRQLKNVIEYMCYTVENRSAKIEDLPLDIKGKLCNENICFDDLLVLMLKEINECNQKNSPVGRRSLSAKFNISEDKTNKITSIMKENEFIESRRGRKGIILLSKGINYIKAYN